MRVLLHQILGSEGEGMDRLQALSDVYVLIQKT